MSRDKQSMLYVFPEGVTAKRMQLIRKGNALPQLAQTSLGQSRVQFRLTEQNHLHQLALLCLQVGQQTQCFETVVRQRLCLVEQQNHAPVRRAELNQPFVNKFEQPVLSYVARKGNTEFLGECHSQRSRTEDGVRAVRRAVVAKYGWPARFSDLVEPLARVLRLQRKPRVGIVLTVGREPVSAG